MVMTPKFASRAADSHFPLNVKTTAKKQPHRKKIFSQASSKSSRIRTEHRPVEAPPREDRNRPGAGSSSSNSVGGRAEFARLEQSGVGR
jgi:hypothetical protein